MIPHASKSATTTNPTVISVNATWELSFMTKASSKASSKKGFTQRIETTTIRLRPSKSAATTIPTAIFRSSSCFSISSRSVMNSNALNPTSMSTNPSRPNEAVPIRACHSPEDSKGMFARRA